MSDRRRIWRLAKQPMPWLALQAQCARARNAEHLFVFPDETLQETSEARAQLYPLDAIRRGGAERASRALTVLLDAASRLPMVGLAETVGETSLLDGRALHPDDVHRQRTTRRWHH